MITKDAVAKKHQQAVTFAERIGNDELANELANLSLEEYAERRNFIVENPSMKGNRAMATTTGEGDVFDVITAVTKIQEENNELRAENERLNQKLDTIYEVTSDDSDEDEDGEGVEAGYELQEVDDDDEEDYEEEEEE
jgi:regulator of replication initiation timing